MSTPVKERVANRSGLARPGTAPAEIPAQRSRPRRGAERAPAARDERLSKFVGDRLGKAAAVPGRTPFALLVMGLLGIGLIATLWLSTAAAADSYRLSDARAAATALREQSEQLRREVANQEAAPAIIAAAQAQGMVLAQDPPRLVVGPDGPPTLVGTPHAVTRPAPIVAPVVDPAVPPAPPAEAETQVGDTPGAGQGAANSPSTDAQAAGAQAPVAGAATDASTSATQQATGTG